MPLLPERFAGPVIGALLLNFAAMVFLGVTGFLAWQTAAWSMLASLRGLAFLVVGLVLSGVLIGALPAWLHRRLAMSLVARNQGEIDQKIAGIIRTTGTVVLLVQLLAVYYLTSLAFNRWIAPIS